jgi:hypothetical protein
VALVRAPFYFINLLPTSLLYISILLSSSTCVLATTRPVWKLLLTVTLLSTHDRTRRGRRLCGVLHVERGVRRLLADTVRLAQSFPQVHSVLRATTVWAHGGTGNKQACSAFILPSWIFMCSRNILPCWFLLPGGASDKEQCPVGTYSPNRHRFRLHKVPTYSTSTGALSERTCAQCPAGKHRNWAATISEIALHQQL